MAESRLIFSIFGRDVNASKTFKDVSGAAGKTKLALEKAFLPATAALGGLAAAAFTFGKAAAEDEKSAAILAKSLQNLTGASSAQVASVEDWIAAQGKALGVADDQLRPALGTLATATKDVGKAQELAGIAMDIAAAKGIDVETAAKAVAKAYAGNTGALGKLIPGLDKAALKSGDFSKIQGELSSIVGGSAATAAETQAGKMQRLEVATGEAQEAIGGALLPVFDLLLPVLQSSAEWVQENRDLIQKLAIGVGVVAAAIVAANIAMKAWAAAQVLVSGLTKAWTAAQWLFNAAMSANPIGLVVVAIAALVAALVLAWNKSETFRKIVTAAWEGIKAAAQAVGRWFTDTLWPLIKRVIDFIVGYYRFLFNVFRAVVGWIIERGRALVTWFTATLWPIIRRVVDLVVGYYRFLWTTFQNVVRWVIEKGAALVGWFTGLPEKIKGALTGMWDGMRDGFRNALNGIIRAWNNFRLTFPSFDGDWNGPLVPGGEFTVGGWTLDTPNLPLLASGGIVQRRRGGTLAVVGEGSNDEAVVPLPRDWRRNGLRGSEVHVHLTGIYAGDERGLARELQRVLSYGRAGWVVTGG